MEGDSSWNSRLSFSASKRWSYVLQSRSDMFTSLDENDGDDVTTEEYICPFCSEYFDIVGFCVHIDEEHPVEAKNGYITILYTNYNVLNSLTSEYMQKKRKSRRAGSYSTLSLLKKELRDGSLQSLLGGSSCILSSSNAAPDPLLSSFISPVADEFASSQSHLHAETRQFKKSSDETVSKRKVETSALSAKDKEEKAKRCDFVQELLMSAILDDNS
ncbi:hypothetical protein RIF29_24562 [Crotalaria pallida]|uniref:Uncharacterized protein n=1 Tax=Crotalaria pallida TaxID=3830 RepID=A0AAN9HZ12_CROPI